MTAPQGRGRMRAVALSVTIFIGSVAWASPAAADDDYQPGGCLANGGIGAHPFTDIAAGSFYADAVAWMFANEITVGVAPTLYGPDQPVTRGQFATMLHRMACLPSSAGVAPFSDLRIGAFYRTAVDWMVGEGITTGKTPTLFGPDDGMTRGQFAAFLHRFVGEPHGAPVASVFGDVDRARYFAAPIDWLLFRSVTQGTSPSTFSPGQVITRAEVATFLYRLNTIGDVALAPWTVSTGFSSPTAAATHPISGDLYVAEQDGRVRRVAATAAGVPDFGLLSTVLDIDSIVLSAGEPGAGNEQGLLGVAVSPGGDLLYVSFTNVAGDSVINEYEITAGGGVDTSGPPRTVIVVDQPHPTYTNHNGGHMTFGPDGYLYAGFGDGGGGGDPLGSGQDTSTLLGAILRIDPFTTVDAVQYASPADNPFAGDLDPGADEIWLYGLRNPWKFTFDRETDVLWIADVGQGAREEITRATAAEAGRNLGWNLREGSIAYNGGAIPPDHLGPVHDYTRADGCSITGGFVYRGSDIPALYGTYLHTDYCTPELRGWRDLAGVEAVDFDISIPGSPTTFAEDLAGEIYVFGRGGTVVRLTRALS